MRAHTLAKKLLAGPNILVVFGTGEDSRDNDSYEEVSNCEVVDTDELGGPDGYIDSPRVVKLLSGE